MNKDKRADARRRREGAARSSTPARPVFAAPASTARRCASCTCSPPSRSSTSSTSTTDELGDDGLQGRAARELVAPGRGDLPRRQDRVRADRARPTTRRSSCCSRWARRSRACDQLARVGFDTLGLQTYLTAGPEGVARLDDPQGRHRAAGRRRHPHRLPARLHQGRGRLLRRPRRRRLDGRGPRRAARCASRARTT